MATGPVLPGDASSLSVGLPARLMAPGPIALAYCGIALGPIALAYCGIALGPIALVYCGIALGMRPSTVTMNAVLLPHHGVALRVRLSAVVLKMTLFPCRGVVAHLLLRMNTPGVARLLCMLTTGVNILILVSAATIIVACVLGRFSLLMMLVLVLRLHDRCHSESKAKDDRYNFLHICTSQLI